MSRPKGLCWCFGSRPPEITLGFDTESPLKPIIADIPMPSDENELNQKFEELVLELDLDHPHRDALFDLPPEKKWQIYCSKKQDKEAEWPDFYIEKIKVMCSTTISDDEGEIAQHTKFVDDLKTALRTQPMSFVTRFIDQEGLQALLNFLNKMDECVSNSSVHTSVIGCVKALMNNSQGRAHVLADPNSINIIAQSMKTTNIKTKLAVLEILGAVCLVPGGHKKVLEAMIHFSKYVGERVRFMSIVNDLDAATGSYTNDVSLKTAIMSFINAALRYGPGKDHLEFRLHLRYEFSMLGIQPIIEKLRKYENATLDCHIDFYEMMRIEDEREFSKRFDGVHVDTKSASGMFELLKKKLGFSTGYPHLLSTLQHLLLLPYGNSKGCTGVWALIDQIVQQVVIQKNGHDPDTAPLDLNVKEALKKLSSESDIKNFQQKLKETEKINKEIQSRLARKERECEIKSQEKEELIIIVTSMKTKLEREREQAVVMEQQLNDTQAKHDLERGERLKLQHLVKTGSLPDDAKVDLSTAGVLGRSVMTTGDFDCPRSSIVPRPPIAPPAPAPPLPPAVPGAPPPPQIGLSPNAYKAMQHQTCPKPKNAMKSLNWTKLPENIIPGTMWSEVNLQSIYSSLDLVKFERTFSAYQRQQNDEEEDAKNTSKLRIRELSVIDGRRAQNCTILLSKLKLSNVDIAEAIWNMDEQEDLPKDMLEQMIKFIPTAEENQLLTEHSQEIDNMARADSFLYEMGKIPHYEQRLNALYFKKKFPDRIGDIKPRIAAVFEASREALRSKKLRRLLEVVLAMGNYMNRGQRGNASGFQLSSLNSIIDTKSSMNRSFTLLHYVSQVLQGKFPDVLLLSEDLVHIPAAAKVSFRELDKDMSAVRLLLKDIEKELTFLRNVEMDPKDRFTSVMSDFLTVSTYNFSEVEEDYTEMKQRFEVTLKCFAEKPKEMQPDDFFGNLDTFLGSLVEVKNDNYRMERQKEEEKKRTQLEETMKKEREKQKLLRAEIPTKKQTPEKNEKGEFDDLISALRTGDVFGEDMAKMKRNRRRGTPITDTSRERVGKLSS